ncbi:GntR family transcriptional regulator [Streptomyces sp. AC550_RSS872]|uniref:GntR family transcriptional regulator n=1 Tax=Streptomyces sp. AC550_RSS872 TaxID=2823689 RepID=UPI001C2600DF|nr:GntR family transcriptional regulator [Streptomyces sp. AC550_RSS872]
MSEDVSEDRSDGEGGATYQWVRGELLNRLTDGTYVLDSRLPSQRELAEEFNVSRDTVQKVLRELAGEGWITSRQGSGTRVIRGQSPISSPGGRSVSLEELMDEAFQKPEVTLDVYTLSSETLAFQIHRQDEQIRLKRPKLQRIALRMLLPAKNLTGRQYPKAVDDKDDAAVWERHLDTMRRSTDAIQEKLQGLKAEGYVPSVDLEIRYVNLQPTQKVYLVNGTAMLSAPYVPVMRPIYLVAHDKHVEAFDVLGVGAPLTYDVKDDHEHSPASQRVANHRKWFDAMWELLARAEHHRP